MRSLKCRVYMWLGEEKCPVKGDVRLWEVENVGFIFGWDQKKCLLIEVSAHGRLKM